MRAKIGRGLSAAATCVVVAVALAACSPAPKGGQAMMSEAPAMDAVGAAVEAAPEPAAAAPSAPGGPAADRPAAAPLLAYAYAAEIEAPGPRIAPMMQAHVAACRTAGPATCNVLESSSESDGADRVSAALRLRAAPKWLEAFRANLESEAKAAKGRLVSTSVTAEDLTREIVDVEARLRAQKTLRDRLQQLLRERPGKLADLLETERELARVQGEIDSAESQLAVMRQRVDMSTLDLAYSSAPTAVSGGTFEPVRNAAADFLGNVALGVAGLITLIGLAAPWVLVLGPALWFGLRWLGRRRAVARAKP